MHNRVWRYPLEGASSLEVQNIVLYIRSPSKKPGRSSWLNARTDRTTYLCPVRINVSKPLSSVMDTDGIMKLLKKLLLTYKQEPSNKLRSIQKVVVIVFIRTLV